MKKLIMLFGICLFSTIGFCWDEHDSILYWQVQEAGNTVDGGDSVYTFLGIDHSDDELGVRIACYDKSGNLVKYLNPVYSEYGIDWDYNDQPIGTRDDFWMTRGSQAYYGPEDYAEKLFQMQIGNYDNDYNFSPLIYSNGEVVDGRYWYDAGTLLPPGIDWTPSQFFTVNPVIPIAPEPNTLFLMLVGSGVLLLRRKHA